MLAGDRDRFGLLFTRYRPMLVNFATARIRDAVDAEAITQDAFVRAFRSLDKLTNHDRFVPWILTITSNLCLDWLQKASRSPVVVDPESRAAEPPAHGLGPRGIAERRELGERIQEAILGLEEPYRTAATMRYLGGLSCSEIAESLDQKIGTITMRISRANRILRAVLGGFGLGGPGAARRETGNEDPDGERHVPTPLE